MKPKVQKAEHLAFVVIDKTKPWSNFDGVFQGEHTICGLGFLLYFLDNNYAIGCGHMGIGTNNRVQLHALLELLHYA